MALSIKKVKLSLATIWALEKKKNAKRIAEN